MWRRMAGTTERFLKIDSRSLIPDYWFETAVVHDISAQHILLSAVHDSTLVPDGMYERECHPCLRLDRQVGALSERLFHVRKESCFPTRHPIVQIYHERHLTFFPGFQPHIGPIPMGLEGLPRAITVEAPPFVKPDKTMTFNDSW